MGIESGLRHYSRPSLASFRFPRYPAVVRLLDRYLLRELLVPLGFCLSGFLIFWVAFNLISDLNHFLEAGLKLKDVVQYYLVEIPEFVVFVLPIALLLALLYTLTNHTRHNELTAMRAAGISLPRICAPYLVLGLVFSLARLALNELWVPSSSEKADQILRRGSAKSGSANSREVIDKLGLRNSRDGRVWIIHAYNPKTAVMTGPIVNWTRKDGFSFRLVAERAEYLNGVWTFFNAAEDRAKPGAETMMLPYLRTNVLAMPEFSETPLQFQREAKFADRLQIRKARSPEMPVVEIIDYLRLHPDVSMRNKWWLETQLQGRLAAPWTCLVAVLIAIPFGAASGRRNLFVGVAGSICICFIYFILLQFGLGLGTGGYLPAWLAAWLPNVSFAALGTWLMLRVR